MKDKQKKGKTSDSLYLPLVFIPFFDGAYIWYDNLVHQVNVNEYIEEYNARNDFIKFKEKVIEKESNILCEDKFNRYLVLSAFLKKISYKETYKLLVIFNIPFTLLTEELLGNILEESTDLKNENLELSEQISMLRKFLRAKKTDYVYMFVFKFQLRQGAGPAARMRSGKKQKDFLRFRS